MMAPISVTDVGFSYFGGEQALSDIDFAADRGTVTLLCGASGSGKSSVLRLLNGLIPHFHRGARTGQVLVEGAEVSASPVWQAGLRTATVFQHPRTQFFTAEVGSEIAFAGQNYRVPADEIRRRTAEALETVGITELADRTLGSLSGGQQQKVACAQAIAQCTGVLLLDEPTSNLDVNAIAEFAALLRRLRDEERIVVVAEHRVHVLAGIADQVLLMADGRIERRMTGEEFFALTDEQRRELGLRSLTPPAWTPQDRDPGPAERLGGGLEIERLRVRFGSRTVLDLADLSVPRGRVTAVTGANGAGKTTLARALCRLQRMDRGSRVLLDGRPLRRGDAFLVMQDVHRQLFSESVSAEAGGVARQALDLSHLAERHPLSLSGGQMQRLVIATALDSTASVLIFDEPTSGVDYRHLLGIAAQLRRLASAGHAVIVISHDPEFLHCCADREIRLDAGRSPAEGALR